MNRLRLLLKIYLRKQRISLADTFIAIFRINISFFFLSFLLSNGGKGKEIYKYVNKQILRKIK